MEQTVTRIVSTSYIGLSIVLLWSCSAKKQDTLFTLTNPEDTGIHFENNVPYTEDFNTYTYRNFYNGGGVALGDINNDGLADVCFTGNMVGNKLYLNKGNWKFEDITERAGISCKGVWSTGATFADVNGDGLLDLYICKAGKPGGPNRHNSLFINNGDLTFTDKAKEYGLDVTGLSIHSSFFDYDRDGDLDCYILNNSLRSVGGYDLKEGQRDVPDPEGNKLFKNDNGIFRDVTKSAGIYSSKIGYGLGITLSDFNLDGWTDIFISNDFFERDYLYYNRGDGTFSEQADQAFGSMSMGSMGADACDMDNDLRPDLFVTEMLPQSLERKKTKTQYETWDKYTASVAKGYHHQFSRNVLQRNIGNGQFLEIGRFAGVSATEWSWASLVQDYDNDGLKDLFVSNGLFKDLLDKDYLNFSANANMIRSQIKEGNHVLTMLIDSMPSHAVANCMFKNTGQFHFSPVSEEWGLSQPSFSNGSAYGDLDNDGDLDLLVNNANMPCFVYRNNLDTSSHRSIRIALQGADKNTGAIGAKVTVKVDGNWRTMEHFPSKGFQSCMEEVVHLGVGKSQFIDSLEIRWPDGKISYYTGLAANKKYTISQKEANFGKSWSPVPAGPDVCGLSMNFQHRDVDINFFTRERLLIHMAGFDGPGLDVADVNGDQIKDVFCGGGRNQGSVLFLSNKDGSYIRNSEDFLPGMRSEVTDAHFFDSDADGDVDLYVAHGGKSFSIYAPELHDILFINDGVGHFTPCSMPFTFPYPIWTSAVASGDINKDGLTDLVIGEKMKTDFYGTPGGLFLLINKGNNIFDITQPASWQNLGMVTDVVVTDINLDGMPDVAACGEWMGIHCIVNDGLLFTTSSFQQIPETTGIWHTLVSCDVTGDGKPELFGGNMGENGCYRTGWRLYLGDFDGNGFMEQLVCQREGTKYFPVHDIDEMFSQLPVLKKKYLRYSRCAQADIGDLFGNAIYNESKYDELEEVSSCVFMQQGKSWKKQRLPDEFQYSSIHAFLPFRDGKNTILVGGGNDFKIKPQFGRLDASLGWKAGFEIRQDSLCFFKPIPLFIQGQVRKIVPFEQGNFLFGINDADLQMCKI